MTFTSMDSSQSSLPDHVPSKPQLHQTTVARRAKGEIQPRDECSGLAPEKLAWPRAHAEV
jgi:hypothetical protein